MKSIPFLYNGFFPRLLRGHFPAMFGAAEARFSTLLAMVVVMLFALISARLAHIGA
ncbi:hypothetical protein QY97_02717 [Bacillus thermotolerans]|nr:hypothetical protein QY97_02717 [Bacillus thermotolerans]